MSEILNKKEIEQFIHQGYVRLDNIFPKAIANAVLDMLWDDLPFERNQPITWIEPVVRLGMYTDEPFIQSVNTSKLHQVFDQLVGTDRWLPCRSVGTFPVRFPAQKPPVDTGKHVDVSFPGTDPADYFTWRANINSKGRALLMLVLYSDVTEYDAPTLLYEGSHLDIARLLSDKGDAGLSFMEIAHQLDQLPERACIPAIGEAGTVYLCHPFLVHAAQVHTGSNPRFMAQPPLFLKSELNVTSSREKYSPVEQAIRLAIV